MSSIYDYNPKRGRRDIPVLRPSRRRPHLATARQWLGYSVTLIFLLGCLCLIAFGVLSCNLTAIPFGKNKAAAQSGQ